MQTLLSILGGKKPKLIMFDLDGTLIDSVPDLAAATDVMLQSLGREPAGIAKVRNWVGNGAQVLVRRALTDGYEKTTISLEQENEALGLFMQAYAEVNSLTEVYSGVLESLKFLQELNIKMALITNKPARFLPNLLHEMGLANYFDWVIGGDTLPQKKPNPAGLLWVMQQAGVKADECLFVGDSKNDIQAAQAAQVASVAVSYGYNYSEPISASNPTIIVDDLRELFL